MEQVIGDGVSIRNFLYGDAGGLAKYGDNPNIAMNQRECFPNPYTVEHARKWIAHVREHQATTRFVIATKKEAIGEIGVSIQPDVHRYSAEIGFWIGESYWGRGLMTKAISWMTEYCFTTLKIKRLFADVIEYNVASQRVLDKCGFTHESTARQHICKQDTFYDQLVYVLINEGMSSPPG